ncbi:TetR-like C-terminal domain-containing protein [Microbacterium sp.]|uniref:TetR-like C-terminal domain-containing protein n=1 Tax=Microbacterium sp. TaxID=51671 RepID=UPI003A8A0708
MNRGTVYRWWPTQTELLNDALQFHERHRADAPDTGSWEGDVRALITQLASLAADPIERALMATMISGRYPTLNETMLSWHRGHQPHWHAMIGRAIGRGEVSPDIDMATLIRTMPSPALTASLFDARALTQTEVDALVTLICRATVPQQARSEGERRA